MYASALAKSMCVHKVGPLTGIRCSLKRGVLGGECSAVAEFLLSHGFNPQHQIQNNNNNSKRDTISTPAPSPFRWEK